MLISDQKLEETDLKLQFEQLIVAIHNMHWVREEAEIKASCEILNERILLEVTAKPILAKIVSTVLLDSSLLLIACKKLNREWSHPAIKFLIEMNPSALMWGWPSDSPIYAIAGHASHCVLMPWIAERYTWILEHETCQEWPPVFELIDMYANRHANFGCSATTIKQFFEHFPQGLTQEREEESPINKIVGGSEECDAEIFIWMAEQCPSSLSKIDCYGHTLLHNACSSLTEGSNRSNEICKFLIENCPVAATIESDRDVLPIHFLVGHCHHRPVQEIVILLLREYPESYEMAHKEHIYLTPQSHPFIQHIKPYLDEEREIKEGISDLLEMSEAFYGAVACTKSSVMRSAATVFNSWATSIIQGPEDRIERISAQLQEVSNEFEGQEIDELDLFYFDYSDSDDY